eukprot:UN00937
MLVLLASLAIFVRYTSATCKAFKKGVYSDYIPLDTCYEFSAAAPAYVSRKYTCSETTGGYEVIPMIYSEQACEGDGIAEDPGEYDDANPGTLIYKQCNGDDDECWCDVSACTETAELRVFPICGEKTIFSVSEIVVINSCFPTLEGSQKPVCYGSFGSSTCSGTGTVGYYDLACANAETWPPTPSPIGTAYPTPAPVVTTAYPTPSPITIVTCQEFVTGCLTCGAPSLFTSIAFAIVAAAF